MYMSGNSFIVSSVEYLYKSFIHHEMVAQETETDGVQWNIHTNYSKRL